MATNIDKILPEEIVGLSFVERMQWLFWQIVATYSNKPSYFASKRIERSMLFMAALGIICCYIYYSRATISATEVMGFVVLMGTWAGFNVKQLAAEKAADRKDKIETDIVSNISEEAK